MRTGASGIASKIFQRRLGYHRSCSRYQYVIWGLQHRLSSPRILLQGGSGIAGVVTGTNVGLRLSSPTTINTLGLEGRCCRTTPLWGNSLSVFLPTHLNADSFGTEGSSGVHVSPKIEGAPMAFISSNNLWVLSYPTAGLGSVSLHCHNFSLLAHWRAATVIHCTASVLLILKLKNSQASLTKSSTFGCGFSFLFSSRKIWTVIDSYCVHVV